MLKRAALILLLLCAAANAAPFRGGASMATTDNIQALLATMSAGQIVTLTNPLCCADVLARIAANFDGSPGGITGVAGAIGGATSSPNPQQADFGRAFCDIPRILTVPCNWRSGGHHDSGDGTIYTVNVNMAAGSCGTYSASSSSHCSGSPLAHTIAVPSCRYIPTTETAGIVTGQSVTNVTEVIAANNTPNTNVIQVADTGVTLTFPGPDVWIIGTGIPDYTSVTGGLGTTTLTLSNNVTVTAGETIQFTSSYWCTPNRTGQYNSIVAHAYGCNAILQNSNVAIFGGLFGWGPQSPGQAVGGGVNWNMASGSTSPGSANCIFYASGQIVIPVPDYADGNWYTLNLSEFQRCANVTPPSCSNIVDVSSVVSNGFALQAIANPSPTAAGSGHQAYFADNGLFDSNGGALPFEFYYFDQIEGNPTCGTRQSTGNPFPQCYGNYTNSPNLFLCNSGCASDAVLRAWTFDGTNFIAWDSVNGPPSSSQLLKVAVAYSSCATGTCVSATQSVEVPASTLNTQINVLQGQCLNIWDLGATYGHAKLFDNCGQLLLGKGM